MKGNPDEASFWLRGVPDPRWNERPLAAVVLKPGEQSSRPMRWSRKAAPDALRLWEPLMGQFKEATNWNEDGVGGTAWYLSRVWGVIRRYADAGCAEGNPRDETLKRAHKTIRTVTDHIERMRYNMALAALTDQPTYIQKLTPEWQGARSSRGRCQHRRG